MFLRKIIQSNFQKNVTKMICQTFSADSNLVARSTLKDHNWLEYDQSHQRSVKTHKSDAEQRIARIPVVYVHDDVVRCMGGTVPGAGHPQVYIKTSYDKPNTCKWCGLKYQKKSHDHDEHH